MHHIYVGAVGVTSWCARVECGGWSMRYKGEDKVKTMPTLLRAVKDYAPSLYRLVKREARGAYAAAVGHFRVAKLPQRCCNGQPVAGVAVVASGGVTLGNGAG